MVALTLAISGCASNRTAPSNSASEGPRIIESRVQPEKIELNNYFQAKQPNQIFAEVQDWKSEVNNVHVQFLNVPMNIPMQRVSGTTWRAELSTDQLKKLAVSGKTMKYRANIIAQDANGLVSSSYKPVEISVEAPDAVQNSG